MLASVEVLAEKGPAGFTVDAVAARAGCGKATIYRRWPSRANLLLDTAHRMGLEPALVDTGSLRDDLVQIMTQLGTKLRDTAAGRILPGVIAEAAVNPEMREVLGRFIRDRRSRPRGGAAGRGPGRAAPRHRRRAAARRPGRHGLLPRDGVRRARRRALRRSASWTASSPPSTRGLAEPAAAGLGQDPAGAAGGDEQEAVTSVSSTGVPRRAAGTTATGSASRTSSARPAAPAVRSRASVVAGAAASDRIAPRRSRVGSARARWSCTTRPAGTNTSHRRARACSDRAPSHASGSPAASTSAPASHCPAASSSAPATGPASTAATPARPGPPPGGGVRSGRRRSSP